ncbi:hypothetical protein BH11BAC7_BH11BAC7_13180 [soil metagenome]
MKKFRLLVFATLVAGSAGAQYFQHTYGSQRKEVLESGVNTNVISPQGHLMTGYTDLLGPNALVITRTNLNGRMGAPLPTFNNRYQIFENAMLVDAKGRSIVHSTALGGRISVWGDHVSGAAGGTVSTKFFYALVTPNGGPAGIWSYALPFPIVEAEATGMCNSITNPVNMFVCGFVRLVAGGQRYPVVMCINGANGAIVWSNVYRCGNIDWIATDVIESPFAPEVALSGHFIRPGAPSSGCFFRVANATGAFIPSIIEYGTPFTPNGGGLNAIDIANNPGPGFVLGGFYNNPANGTDDSWAINVNATGFVVNFSTLVDYTMPGNNDYGNDVIERLNTTGVYEYYLGGYVANGVFGGEDDVVYKLDFNGIPANPGAQFTYGGPGNERAIQLAQYNGFGVNNNGLSVYGNTVNSWAAPGASDFYFVKSYFNGVTRCNYDLRDVPSMVGPGIIEWWNATMPYSLMQSTLTMNVGSMQDFEICWAPLMAPPGDNTRLAASTEISQPGYFPNPVSRENGIVTVTFGRETVAGVAQVELWNSLGQICWTKQISVADGQSGMQVELGNELQGGMYHLIVRQNGTLNNYRILVQ